MGKKKSTRTKKAAIKPVEKETPPKKIAFEAKISNPKKVQLIFDVAGALVDDVMLKCGKTGISIDTIDDSRVGMLSVNLTKAFFENYRNGFGEFNWCIDIRDLMKILKRSTSKDTLLLYRDEDSMEYLQVRIIKGKRQRTFKLKTKASVSTGTEEDIEESDRLTSQIKEIATQVRNNATAKFILDADYLNDIIKDAFIVSDLILIQAFKDDNEIIFSSYEDAGEFESILNADETYFKKAIIKDDSEGFYSLDYIESVLKLKPIVEDFEMGIGDYSPLLVSCQFLKDEGKLSTGDPGSFSFLLAPRVDDSDEEKEEEETDENLREAIEEATGEEFTEEDFELNR
jgi:DNA polymerase III sliding clamp (beta) subunit (PCNA family)